ncbi:hypothetical protein MBLNU230_g1289t1 [Neophaeotheca triangularis]
MSEVKSPGPASQTTFGCPHIKSLLGSARKPALEGYTKIITTIKEGGVATRIHKNGNGTSATATVTYLCLQCPNVSSSREQHSKKHLFSVESMHGYVYCHDCRDLVYDPTFEAVRTEEMSPKKRKHSSIDAGSVEKESKRLLATNSTPSQCAATGLRGFYNMGQTCFMSVIMQSIIHNPIIRIFFLTEGHKSSDCDREICIACTVDDIFTDFFGQEKHEGYGAVHLLQACWKNGGSLAGYDQHDAHEFLGFILNGLHAAITNTEETGEDAGKDCGCIIHSTFGGLMSSTVTCTKCENTTSTLDPFMDLSLDIKNTAFAVKKKKQPLTNSISTEKVPLPMDLTECLDRFTAPETLSADSYRCHKCESSQEAKKRLTLSRLPPVLPIHLKRFSHSQKSSQSSKVETRVRFPFVLDLEPYASKSSSENPVSSDAEPFSMEGEGENADSASQVGLDHTEPKYTLSSVIVHKGKIDNGHYINYSRQGNEWFRFDDSMVVLVEEKEVLAAEAYMLIYIVSSIGAG